MKKALPFLALAALGLFILYAALDAYYPGMIFLYGLSSYEPDPFERAFLFWFSGTAILVTIGLTLGIGLLLPAPAKSHAEPKTLPRSTYALAALALVLLFTAKLGVLHHSATMDDDNVYRFTARLLAHGKLSLPTDIPAEFFANRWGINYRNGRLYPMYSHGWPALLAIGYLLHAPWIISPLVALSVMLLACDFARRVYGVPTARLAFLFFATSPFFILTGGTDLSPLAGALGVLIAVNCISRYFEDHRPLWLLLAGVGGGLTLQARQLSAAGLLTPIFLYALYRIFKDKQHGVMHATALVVPVGVSMALYLAANYAMNGDPFTPNYVFELAARGVKGGSPLGFGIDYPLATGGTGLHTVGQGFLNSALNLIRLNTWLLGWPLSLLLVFGARFNTWTRLLLTAFGCQLIAYTTFFSPGLSLTGPTYFYDAGALLLVLAASGVKTLGAWYRARPESKQAPRLEGAFVTAIIAINLTMFIPITVRSLSSMTEGTSLLPRTLESQSIHNAVVFVANVQAPWRVDGMYNSFAYHPESNASFDDDVVILNDLGAEKDAAALAKYFPNRAGYTYKVGDNWAPVLTVLRPGP